MISRGIEANDLGFLFVLYHVYLLGNQMMDEGFLEDFSEQMETAIRTILFAIQNLAERTSKKTEENMHQTGPQEEDGMCEIRQKLVSYLIIFNLMIYFCG